MRLKRHVAIATPSHACVRIDSTGHVLCAVARFGRKDDRSTPVILIEQSSICSPKLAARNLEPSKPRTSK
ncbi:hypothetical protein E4U55_001729, partial [Claviceps digitariae]